MFIFERGRGCPVKKTVVCGQGLTCILQTLDLHNPREEFKTWNICRYWNICPFRNNHGKTRKTEVPHNFFLEIPRTDSFPHTTCHLLLMQSALYKVLGNKMSAQTSKKKIRYFLFLSAFLLIRKIWIKKFKTRFYSLKVFSQEVSACCSTMPE